MITMDSVALWRGNQRILSIPHMTISRGNKTLLTGASGCGKSTLLMAVMAAIPHHGYISVDGLEVKASSAREVRNRIAFIGQEPEMGAETVQEALLLPFTYKANRHNAPSKQALRDVLQHLKMEHEILSKPCPFLSGGEKQRIAVGRALLLGKRIFLADEVTSALDAASKHTVLDLLSEPHMTVLAVSHDADWIQWSSHQYHIEAGTMQPVEGSCDGDH